MAERNSLKTVVITGGATGIGFETARKLLEEKEYRVVIIGKRPERVQAATEELHSFSDRLTSYVCDLANPDQLGQTMDKILSSHKTIYGLVNNAGIYPFGDLGNTTSQAWDETMQINLKTPFLVTQALKEAMTRSPGGARVVNMSSTAGLLPNHFALAYSVSKAALIQFTKTIAKELGKDGITANCICPGIVKTPMHDAYHSSRQDLETFYAKKGATFPAGRVGRPEDIAGTVKYLLSEDAGWITGEVLVVDGGRLLL